MRSLYTPRTVSLNQLPMAASSRERTAWHGQEGSQRAAVSGLGESAKILANSKESAVCQVQQAGRLEGERKCRSLVTHS